MSRSEVFPLECKEFGNPQPDERLQGILPYDTGPSFPPADAAERNPAARTYGVILPMVR